MTMLFKLIRLGKSMRVMTFVVFRAFVVILFWS